MNTVYYITIIVRATGTIHNLVRSSETIDQTVAKELGGWDNLHAASTSGTNHTDNEYFQAGTTKDDSKCFSILAVNPQL